VTDSSATKGRKKHKDSEMLCGKLFNKKHEIMKTGRERSPIPPALLFHAFMFSG
jgi:hypothetical protein